MNHDKINAFTSLHCVSVTYHYLTANPKTESYKEPGTYFSCSFWGSVSGKARRLVLCLSVPRLQLSCQRHLQMWILAGYVIFHYPTSFGCLQHGGCPPAQGTKSQRDEHRSQGTSEEALCYLHRVLQVTEMARQCVCGKGGGHRCVHQDTWTTSCLCAVTS